MKLKRGVLGAIAAITFASVIPQVSASVPASEMSLGSISAGTSINYVRQVYGMPNRTEDMGGLYKDWYGDSVSVVYRRNGSSVMNITSSANNGFKTPSGLTVGQSKNDVVSICGSPDDTFNIADRKTFMYDSYDRTKIMRVVFDKKGKVAEISIEINTGT